MTAVVQRYFSQTPNQRGEWTDLIVFVATTGLCALGAVALPLVG